MLKKAVATCLAIVALTGASWAQKEMDFPTGEGIPRGSIHAVENDIDIRGLRLGDAIDGLQEFTNALMKEHGEALNMNIDRNTIYATSTNGRNTLRFDYPRVLRFTARDEDIKLWIEVGLGTPASESLVASINRLLEYIGDASPSLADTIAAVKEKYGEPTRYTPAGDMSRTHYLYYVWVDGEFLTSDTEHELFDECMRAVFYAYRYGEKLYFADECTATLLVTITLDDQGRVTKFNQSLTSAARNNHDQRRADAAIFDLINSTTTGGDLPRL